MLLFVNDSKGSAVCEEIFEMEYLEARSLQILENQTGLLFWQES